MRFEDIINITGGEVIELNNPSQPTHHLLTDSRKGIFNAGSVFFAIPGVRHDGHLFIHDLYASGVRQFIVQHVPQNVYADTNMLLVADTVQALQTIAAAHRSQFAYPVVGITGSNGKTIVKEWLAQLLSPYQQVIRNPKSYNSQIGVPLSVWNMRSNFDIAIFEAGISQPGEMDKLAAVIQPTTGIFTNLGPAHDEGFESREQKVAEKIRLFESCHTILYSRDYPLVDQAVQRAYTQTPMFTWSARQHPLADLQLLQVQTGDEGTYLHLVYQPKVQQFMLQVLFQDEISIENLLCCITYMLVAGYDVASIQKGLNLLRPVNMRMEWKQGIHHCYLLDDSYSNDLLSLQMALEFMQQQTQDRQTVILSDILQTGQPEEVLYEEVRQLLLSKHVQKLITVGSHIGKYKTIFDQSFEHQHFGSTQAFLKQAEIHSFNHENILIKGARSFQFEKIVSRLQQKIHSTTLEIDLDALTHNLNFYKSQLQEGTRIMVMVKAFSYGGGAFEIANLLQFHQVDYLAVAYVDEGVTLREHGIRIPILVLNPSPGSFDKMFAYGLEPEIYSLRMLHQFLEEAKGREGVPAIHIKIDSGMHRLGFELQQLDGLLSVLAANPQLQIASIFSHLAVSEVAEEEAFTRQQIARYQQAADTIADKLSYTPLRHILNSAGIIRYPEYHFDMVRLGIGLYGIEPNHWYKSALKNISTLKTVVSQIKEIGPGETIGYGRRGVAGAGIRIATIAIGYADGFDRGFGNGNASVYINGQPAPTVGSICMDMTMIDVSNITVQEGDEVAIFGEQQSVEMLAEKIGTIPYEMLTGISERVKRVYFTDNA